MPAFTINTPVRLDIEPDCAEIDRWLRAQGCRCRVGRGSNSTFRNSTQAPRLFDYGPAMRLPPQKTIALLTDIFNPKWGVMEGWEPWARFLFRDRSAALLFKLTFGGVVAGQ